MPSLLPPPSLHPTPPISLTASLCVTPLLSLSCCFSILPHSLSRLPSSAPSPSLPLPIVPWNRAEPKHFRALKPHEQRYLTGSGRVGNVAKAIDRHTASYLKNTKDFARFDGFQGLGFAQGVKSIDRHKAQHLINAKKFAMFPR